MARFVETLMLSGLKPRHIETRHSLLHAASEHDATVVLRVEATQLDVTVIVDRVSHVVTQRNPDLGLGR